MSRTTARDTPIYGNRAHNTHNTCSHLMYIFLSIRTAWRLAAFVNDADLRADCMHFIWTQLNIYSCFSAPRKANDIFCLRIYKLKPHRKIVNATTISLKILFFFRLHKSHKFEWCEHHIKIEMEIRFFRLWFCAFMCEIICRWWGLAAVRCNHVMFISVTSFNLGPGTILQGIVTRQRRTENMFIYLVYK